VTASAARQFDFEDETTVVEAVPVTMAELVDSEPVRITDSPTREWRRIRRPTLILGSRGPGPNVVVR
jgi:hypothetical protein